MRDLIGGFSGSPLLNSGLSPMSWRIAGPLGGSSSSESVLVRSIKMVVGLLTAAGSSSASPSTALCCLESLVLPTVSLASLEPLLSSRPTLVGCAGGVDSHALAGAFLCFLPPLFRFLRAGASEEGGPGVVSVRDGEDACRRLDLQGLSAGAAHGSHGEMNPRLGRTPLA